MFRFVGQHVFCSVLLRIFLLCVFLCLVKTNVRLVDLFNLFWGGVLGGVWVSCWGDLGGIVEVFGTYFGRFLGGNHKWKTVGNKPVTEITDFQISSFLDRSLLSLFC